VLAGRWIYLGLAIACLITGVLLMDEIRAEMKDRDEEPPDDDPPGDEN
jgi:hypothetical protein